MQLAVIKGRATSTVKHGSLSGTKLLVAQMLNCEGVAVSDPVLVIDRLGAGKGDRVMLTSDGEGLRQMLKSDTSPARWWTLGIVDHNGLQTPGSPTPRN
jgi:ethanolamine utilization protein EutN